MPDPNARSTWQALERLGAEANELGVADMRLVELPGNVPPWSSTDMHVGNGERISLLASGRLVLAEALDLWLSPRQALWARVGGCGPIVNGTRDTTTFRAVRDGVLEIALCNGEWATTDGALATPPEAYATSGGLIDVVVICWRGDAVEGLAALARLLPDDVLIAGELERLRRASEPPPGWRHLWFLGPTECFSAARAEDGRAAIRVDAANDVGILQKPVEFPLGPATTLAWRWRVDELPAVAAEDSPIAHDYTSVALEFENGQDLTWYWSAALPSGTHYRCPLPTWTPRETHWVVRTGDDGLGRWHEERRLVADDYRTAVGADVPARVVAVWLIAVSVFGHRRGRASFADVVLSDGMRELRVV